MSAEVKGQITRYLSMIFSQDSVDAEQKVKLPAFCQHYGYSQRTAQRRISEAGTTYSDLLLSVRRTRGAELVMDGLTAKAIAAQLGFRDKNGFLVMFKREHGMSPGQYRQQELTNNK